MNCYEGLLQFGNEIYVSIYFTDGYPAAIKKNISANCIEYKKQSKYPQQTFEKSIEITNGLLSTNFDLKSTNLSFHKNEKKKKIVVGDIMIK